MSNGRMRFTGIVEPGAYRIDDFASCGPRIPGRSHVPGVSLDETVYIHLPTNEVWSAEMIDAVFPHVPDTLTALATVVRVPTRMVFERRRGVS
jgi:hypothetical protein